MFPFYLWHLENMLMKEVNTYTYKIAKVDDWQRVALGKHH